MSQAILMKEFRDLSSEKWLHIELDNENIYRWSVALIVLNPESMYYGGYLKSKLTIPNQYPYLPPKFQFVRPLFHPNIYPDGKLCISILHPPGEDLISGELASERWSPAQRIESVLISILSLLDDAEVSSPANVDAGVMLRTKPDDFKAAVKRNVEESKLDIPKDFVMPTSISPKQPQAPKFDDEDFWYDSGAEESSGESASEVGSNDDQEEDDDDENEGEDENDDEMAPDSDDDKGSVKLAVTQKATYSEEEL